MKKAKWFMLVLFVAFVAAAAVMAQQKTDEKVVCPVSGETMVKSQAKATAVYEGKTYYFCCESCREKFLKGPKAYLEKKADTKEIYTCSMHPDVQSDKPGKCPKCGMNLEKKAMPMGQNQPGMVMPHGLGGTAKIAGQTCPMMDAMSLKDVVAVSENTKDGVVLRFTAKDPETIKKLQEMGAKCVAMHADK